MLGILAMVRAELCGVDAASPHESKAEWTIGDSMTTQNITPQIDSPSMVASGSGSAAETEETAPAELLPSAAKLGETEASKDPAFAVSELPGGRRPPKQTSFPAKNTKLAETSIQVLPRDPNIVPSSDFIKDYMAYADRFETPPLMHESIAIAGVAALANGKVWIRRGKPLSLDLWIIVLTPSGSGKNTALSEFRTLLREAGLANLVHKESWGSGPYIQQYFAENPSGFFIWPEMSLMLNQFKQRHFAGAQEFLTNLYDEIELPDSKHYRETGDPQHPGTPSIEFPSAPRTNFLATSSPSWFFGAVTNANVTGGFIPRWIPLIVTEPDRSVPLPAAADASRVGPLAEKLKQIAELSGEMDLSLVESDYQDWYKTTHQRFQSHPLKAYVMPFWRRLRDHVLKLAVVYELSTSATLKLSPESMRRAIDTARIIEQNVYELVQSSFSKEGVESQNLENYIREAGPNGRSQSEVMQFLRGEERPAALNRIAMLVDAGIAQWFIRKTAGRPAMILVHTEHLDAHAKAHPEDQVYSARR
jgi:hypothetical protein